MSFQQPPNDPWQQQPFPQQPNTLYPPQQPSNPSYPPYQQPPLPQRPPKKPMSKGAKYLLLAFAFLLTFACGVVSGTAGHTSQSVSAQPTTDTFIFPGARNGRLTAVIPS